MSQSRLWVLNYNSAPQCMEDEELVAGLQCGDARAVEYLVQQYAPALYRFAYYQLQDASLAEDLVSDVMVRVIGRVGGFVLAPAEQSRRLFRPGCFASPAT